MKHEPHHYDVPNHVRKLSETPDFKAAAKELGIRGEDLIGKLGEEVKRLVVENRVAELAEFEKNIGPKALSDLVAKLKPNA